MYILLLNGMLGVGDEPLQDQPYNILSLTLYILTKGKGKGSALR
jgi:hypothetical protein